ncbi:hypothetical protein PENTCL1PPCAC_12150, partial [Pristionchus entomophagus]
DSYISVVRSNQARALLNGRRLNVGAEVIDGPAQVHVSRGRHYHQSCPISIYRGRHSHGLIAVYLFQSQFQILPGLFDSFAIL